MDKKKTTKLALKELFIVKAGTNWGKTFVGYISRDKDDIGNSIYRGNVSVVEGEILSIASSEKELGKNLDEICLLKLEFGLHSHISTKIDYMELGYFLN